MTTVNQKSAEQLKILFDFAPDAYYLNDLNAVFIDGNKAAEKITGYRKDELIGKNYFDLDLIDEDEKEKSITMMLKISEGKTPDPDEYRIKRKDGTYVHVEINAFPTQYNGQDVILGIARDITERKETENQLRLAREELEVRVAERTMELEEANRELEQKSRHLQEANTALKVLLKRRDEDQAEIEEKMSANITELIMPMLSKLKNSQLQSQEKTWLDIIESNLKDIMSSMIRGLNLKFMRLTPTEIQIANLIKQNLSTKEIADLQGVAKSTVDTYRDNIRRKVGIKNKKINLKTFLQNLR